MEARLSGASVVGTGGVGSADAVAPPGVCGTGRLAVGAVG